jgi:hypothetical protein
MAVVVAAVMEEAAVVATVADAADAAAAVVEAAIATKAQAYYPNGFHSNRI